MAPSANDKRIIGDLVKRVDEISSKPENDEKNLLWLKANSLKPEDRRYRPPVYVSIHDFSGDYEGGYLPVPTLECEDPDFRDYELKLRYVLYRYKLIPDDLPVEKPVYRVDKTINGWGDWGVNWKRSERAGKGGSWKFEPVITRKSQLETLKTPVLAYDAEDTEKKYRKALDLFGEITDVVLANKAIWPSFHLMGEWCLFRGLEQVMTDMYDDPEFLHSAMRIIADGNMSRALQAEKMGILSNGGVWVKAEEFRRREGDESNLTLKDIFTFVEAQELTLVSPEMHKEFALQYERPIAESFGLCTYGCCEDLTNKLDDLFEIKNLRQIGVTPWADTETCAYRINTEYGVSWRPNPAHLAGGYDRDHIRGYLRQNLEALRKNGCACHVFLKDIHSCGGSPERFTEWTLICKEEIQRLWG